MEPILTQQEIEILELLDSAADKFSSLPDLLPWEGQDFLSDVQEIQGKILKRPFEKRGMVIMVELFDINKGRNVIMPMPGWGAEMAMAIANHKMMVAYGIPAPIMGVMGGRFVETNFTQDTNL